MVARFFAPRPAPAPALQYDGTNAAELEALLQPPVQYGATVVQNEDATCTVTNLMGEAVYEVGDWCAPGLAAAPGCRISDADLEAYFQEVPGLSVLYTITDGS